MTLGMLFFRFRCEHHGHALAFELRHHLHFRQLFEVGCETQQQYFTLLLEYYGTTAEEYIRLHLRSLLKEVLGVLQLEVVVVVVGLRSETYLFNDYLHGLGLDFFGLFLLVVQEFLVIGYARDWGVGVRRYLYEVEFHLVGEPERVADGHYFRFFNVVPHDPYLRRRDVFVNLM